MSKNVIKVLGKPSDLEDLTEAFDKENFTFICASYPGELVPKQLKENMANILQSGSKTNSIVFRTLMRYKVPERETWARNTCATILRNNKDFIQACFCK